MATPFSRSLQPGSLYDKWSLMDTALRVRGMEIWCPPVQPPRCKRQSCGRLSHSAGVGQYFLNQITVFICQQNADILSCNYRLIITQCNADKWMDCIWRLINSMHRAGSGRDLLPSLRRWTQLCVSQTLIIHVPLIPDKLFRAYSSPTHPIKDRVCFFF